MWLAGRAGKSPAYEVATLEPARASPSVSPAENPSVLQPRALITSLLFGLVPLIAEAQSPPVRQLSLDAPAVVAKPDFTRIAGVFELPDGRVLVSDRSDERVLVVDLAKASSALVGRAGSGPAEYRMPGRFIRWAADSILLVDEGNERLAVIAPDLKIARSFSARVPGVPAGLVPRAVDPQGRMYAQVSRWAAGGFGKHGDSIPIIRISRNGSDREVLAWVIALAEPADGIKRGLPYIPFSPQDVWAANSQGEVIIARAGDYHIERITTQGTSRGPRVAFTPLKVTAKDKFAYTKSFLEHSSIGGKGGPNATPSGLSPLPPEMLQKEEIERLVSVNPFASVKAPFTDDLPLLSVSGIFWVTRSVPLEARPILDGFDPQGNRVREVTLPVGRRAVAVGQRSLYAIAEDPDGFERLEQYPLPD